jgi:hypothetical protein
MTSIDEIIHIYKTPSEHAKYIASIEKATLGDSILPKENKKLYFKITNRKEIHRKFQYRYGLNCDTNEFNPTGCCSGGGLYFTTLENLYMFNKYGTNIRPLFVPSNIEIYDEVCTNPHHTCPKTHFKSKASSIYLLPKIKLGSPESFELLYDANNSTHNNTFIMSRMYLSDDMKYLDWYTKYYTAKYHVDTMPYKKTKDIYTCRRKTHPEQKELIHCIVKKDIVEKQYDKLFDTIYNKKKLFNGYYSQSMYYARLRGTLYSDKTINISELFYIFLKHQDKSIVLFLKNEYIPRLLSQPHIIEKSTPFHINIPLAVKNITLAIQKMIDPAIYDIILKHKGVVSGSFALKHVSNMDWESNDIDIYLPAIEIVKPSYTIPACIQYYLLNPYKEIILSIRQSTKCICYREDGSFYNMSTIDSIICIEQSNKIKIQLIFVKEEPFEFIKNNFDFDFCKCCFRPSDNIFEIAHPNLNSIQTGSIDKAYMDKISKYNMDCSYSVYRAAKTMDRITKYIERGFTIANLDEFFECIEKLFED